MLVPDKRVAHPLDFVLVFQEEESRTCRHDLESITGKQRNAYRTGDFPRERMLLIKVRISVSPGLVFNRHVITGVA